MDGHLSDLLHLLKNRQKSDSFDAHFKQHFNNTTSHTHKRKYMTFKVLKQLNMIGTMKTFTKPYSNLCMKERLTILKNLRENAPQLWMRTEIYMGPAGKKTILYWFLLSTDDPVFNGLKG